MPLDRPLESRAETAERATSRREERHISAPLPPALVEELGRILGEALVQEFQRDSDAMGKTRSGFTHTGEDE